LLAAIVGTALLVAVTPASAQVNPSFRLGFRAFYNPATPLGRANLAIGTNQAAYGAYRVNAGLTGAALNANYTYNAYNSRYYPGGSYYPYGPYNPANSIPPIYPSYPAYPSYNPYLYSGSAYNPYLGAGTGYQASLATSANGGTVGDPYANSYATNPYIPYTDPVSGYLYGVAALTTANANAAVTYTRAGLLREELFRSQLDTRRKIWEEARYERANLMNSLQWQQMVTQSALDRARNNPALTEIWAGQSLNDMFTYLKAQQAKGITGPTIPLNEDTLKHINLTTGNKGNAGLLKSDILWPTALMRPEFEEPRKNLDKQIPIAVGQARTGRVNQGLTNDISADVQKMHDILLRNVSDIPPGPYIEAKRYLNLLNEAAKALTDPNVSNYFNDAWTAKGKDVGALVKYMGEKGLKFAPAAPGDEWAYSALQQSLAAYDAQTPQLQTAPPPPKQP